MAQDSRQLPRQSTAREIHYTFVLVMAHEDEEFEGQFEDGLDNILETAGYIGSKTDWDLDLHKKVVSGDA
jgi:hypothetical protein